MLILLLLVAVLSFIVACTANEPDQTNKSGNRNADRKADGKADANSNQAGNTNTREGIAPEGKAGRRIHEQVVEILVRDAGGGKCAIEVSPASQTVYLKRRRDRVRWNVTNDCEAASEASIVIENFGNNNSKPFGGDACDNRFVFDPIARGDDGRLITKTGKVDGRYKYTIKLVAASRTIAELDPEIIVGFEVP